MATAKNTKYAASTSGTSTKKAGRSTAAAKTSAKSSAKAPPKVKRPSLGSTTSAPGGPPFGSFEGFLFEVLTLRSNPGYREDVALLMKYEEDYRDRGDWIAVFKVDDRPFQAAQSLIATWELICKIVKDSYPTQVNEFVDAVYQVGAVYLWMKPVMDKLADQYFDSNAYAPNFKEVGAKAFETSRIFKPIIEAAGPDLQSNGTRQRDAYRTAWNKAKPLTHFG